MAFSGWHCVCGEQNPFAQMFEQQLAAEVHPASFGWHGVPASEGSWHAKPPPVAARQSAGAQHSPEPAHVWPIDLQTLGVHCRPPSAPGTHGAPPQHWSLNWHCCPVPMQHGVWPVQPVGQLTVSPP